MGTEDQPARSAAAGDGGNPETNISDVRSQLRRLGYLDHSVERFLLQDALRPEQPLRTVLLLSAKVGLLSGSLLAVAAALVLAALNGLLQRGRSASDPFDILPLFLHLVPPFAVLVGAGFLVLAGVLALVLHLSHTRRIELASFATATAVGTVAVAFLASRSRPLLAALERWQQGLLAVVVALLTAGFVKVVHGGLLTLSIRLSDRAPERRTSRWLWRALLAMGTVFLLLVPAVLDVGGTAVRAAPSVPVLPGARVAVIGLDGVLADELAFLRAGGELPGLDARLASGGRLIRYRRPAVVPASLWTTLGSGIPDPDHGLVSLDSFRPLGMSRPLTRVGWLRHYFHRVAVPAGLVRYQPVLSASRRVPLLWELVAQGGLPVVAVNWWGTFPATASTGLVVAHGAYQLLDQSVDGVVAPKEVRAGMERLRSSASGSPLEHRLSAVLDAAALDDARQLALRPDAFYRSAFAEGLTKSPSVAALYLPALDILSTLLPEGSLVFGDVVRDQVGAADALLAAIGPEVGTVVMVFDPGRRDPDADGWALVWNAEACGAEASRTGGAEERDSVTLGALASALIRGLGLPQSREIPDPPPACRWPAPSLVIDTFGRRATEAASADGEVYLDSLRSLGYL